MRTRRPRRERRNPDARFSASTDASPSVPRAGVTSTLAWRMSGGEIDPRHRHLAHPRIRHLAGDEERDLALELIRHPDRSAVPGMPHPLPCLAIGESHRALKLYAFVDFDLVSHLDVVVVADPDPALGPARTSLTSSWNRRNDSSSPS